MDTVEQLHKQKNTLVKQKQLMHLHSKREVSKWKNTPARVDPIKAVKYTSIPFIPAAGKTFKIISTPLLVTHDCDQWPWTGVCVSS